MIQVLLKKNNDFKYFFEMTEGNNFYYGGLNSDGYMFCDENCPYKEMMIRTIVFKCLNENESEVKAKEQFGLNLIAYGFDEKNGEYIATAETLKLPKC